MQTLLPIGDFSRMTHLSVKALRHYHDVGLLAPARIDPATGYRYYRPDQISTAQVIRRFRDLGMPLDGVKAVLQAPDVTARNEVIVAHLRHMESQLAETQATVASLRALLERPEAPLSVEYRSVPRIQTLAITESVRAEEAESWGAGAFEELFAAIGAAGAEPAGPSGALFFDEIFEEEVGEVVVFVPVTGPREAGGRVRPLDIPAAELAVAVHQGPVRDLDTTYGALGTLVAERAIGVPGPIREYYLVTGADTPDESRHRTEVCWPIFQTTARN